MLDSEILENPYLCPRCDFVSSIPNGSKLEDLKCGNCDFSELTHAIHINQGTRKLWIKVEESGKWKPSKKLKKSLKNDLCDNKKWIDRLDFITKEIFDFFNNCEHTELFPHYRMDYARTTKKSVRLGKGAKYKVTKRGSIRGELYEGLFRKAIDGIDHIERCTEYFAHPTLSNGCRPDAIISFGPKRKFPVEFKTLARGDFLLNKISKHLGQSHAQGVISDALDINKNGISMLIECCPEERIYSCLLLDQRIKGRITHLKGKPSRKRLSRERNRKAQEELRNRKRQNSKNNSRKDGNGRTTM